MTEPKSGIIVAGFDMETTGLLEGDDHRICEIAFVFAHLKADGSHEFPGKFVRRINPQRPIPADATAVHGITFEDVSGCPVFADLAPQIVTCLKGADLIVTHNGRSFDLPFVKRELARVGRAMPPVRFVDTMVEARWATPLGKLPNLGELCFATGVNYDKSKAHAAEYDVMVMLEAYFVGLRKGFFSTTGETF